MSRSPLLVLPAALALALPASAAAKVPTLEPAPSVGGRTTTFVLTVPARVAERADKGADIVPFVTHRKERCDPPVIPKVKRRGDGSVVVRMRPAYMRPDQKRWCTGVHRIRLVAQTVIDDDEETGEGGIFDELLARGSFRVR